MSCLRPLKAYVGHGGAIAWDSVRGFGDRPIELPCGQCIPCRRRRAEDWTVRCLHELQVHDGRGAFVTLTYDEDQVPQDGSLEYSDFQRFSKYLRRFGGPFRFFMCGEYGDENRRPHYHALVFGQDFADREPWRQNERGEPLFRSKLLERCWQKGHSVLGAITRESAQYVCRYAMKKQTAPHDDESASRYVERYGRYDPETGEFWCVRPEFIQMSRRPGIGAGWLEKYAGDVYPRDEVILGGKRFRVPRYYDSLFADVDPKAVETAKRRRKDIGAKHQLTDKDRRRIERHNTYLLEQTHRKV